MKRRNPSTSIDAWHSVKNTPMLSDHHKKIIEALTTLQKANYEEIAKHIQFKNINQVGRRLKEMELKNLIIKTGEKTSTSSGRSAFVYKLVPQPKKEIKFEVVQSRLF